MSQVNQAINPEVAALEKAWWDTWWAQDFSWEGLAKKPGVAAGKTLQDYWRSEEAHLISEPGSDRRWTRFHCPFVFRDGTASIKAGLTGEQWSQWLSELELDGANLSGAVLDDLDPIGNIDARWAYIKGAILRPGQKDVVCDFSSSWIGGRARFSNITLRASDFSGATFCGAAVFTRTTFDGGARFKDARFLGLAEFIEARFEGLVAQDENADFSNAAFASGGDFSQANFEAEAIFNGARFAGRTNFFGTMFEDRALFDDIQCLENIHFYKAAFVRRLTINSAKFYGKANFEGVTDGDPIALSPQPIALTVRDANVTGELSPGTGPTPRSYLAMPKLLARDAVFYQDANFSNRDLLSPSTFEGAQFLHLARFHGSEVHANVSFHNALFRKALSHRPQSLPPFPEDLLKLRFCANPPAEYRIWKKAYLKERADKLKAQFGRNGYFDALEASYRTLKQMMEDRRDRIREGEFFTLELLARRKRSDVPWWERTFSWLYATFANYGNSIFRPLFTLLASLAVFSAAYYQVGESVIYHAGTPDPGHMISAFSFAWHNMFAPFSVLDAGKLAGDDKWLNDILFRDQAFGLGVKIAATLQSMLTIVLAFLFALAARRRFQIN